MVVDASRLGGIATEVPLKAEVIDDKINRLWRSQAAKADAPWGQQPLAVQAIKTDG